MWTTVSLRDKNLPTPVHEIDSTPWGETGPFRGIGNCFTGTGCAGFPFRFAIPGESKAFPAL
jgi:hypothetical protein